MRSAISNSTAPMNHFAFNFPIKFTGTYHVPLFHFLMVCAVEIVSRTFPHALGIPSSVKSPFQTRPLFLMAITCPVLSKILASLAPHPCSSQRVQALW